jgi:hypothetical protein
MSYLGSMTPVRHHIRVSVFKCILTASVLAVFAVQMSYNCQRLPDPVGVAVGAGADAAVAGRTVDFNGRSKVHLCPDKRYALQPIFLLTCGRHRLASVFPAGVHFCPVDSHPAIAMASRLHSLRGPPQQLA